jgi:hypothetical protein
MHTRVEELAKIIQIGKKGYRWSEVRQVSIEQGPLKVSEKDGR